MKEDREEISNAAAVMGRKGGSVSSPKKTAANQNNWRGKKYHMPVVTISHKQTITTSLEVARVFEKRHDNVLDAISNLEIPDNFRLLNFKVVEYIDAKGEKRPVVNLTRDGFTLLGMGFTGAKAMTFKLAYIEAFNRMEKKIPIRIKVVRGDAETGARELGKVLRRESTDTIKLFVEYAMGQGSVNAARYYVSITKMENAALFFLEQKYTNLREALNLEQLMLISVADRVVSKALQDGMSMMLPYKDIYVLAKERVVTMVETVGKTTVPANLAGSSKAQQLSLTEAS